MEAFTIFSPKTFEDLDILSRFPSHRVPLSRHAGHDRAQNKCPERSGRKRSPNSTSHVEG
ncbi:hypothetical protein HPP92_021931, partial [Vanilla planifolia]